VGALHFLTKKIPTVTVVTDSQIINKITLWICGGLLVVRDFMSTQY